MVADVHGLLGPVPLTVIACTRALYSVAGDKSVTVHQKHTQTRSNFMDIVSFVISLQAATVGDELSCPADVLRIDI